mmetsp:Transcript_23482/g.40029  ORF Transcript_23482/g.40029 Transcript_23482/m.40029 type:complete len:107 (+) Transcript_23482:700-1020(+)
MHNPARIAGILEVHFLTEPSSLNPNNKERFSVSTPELSSASLRVVAPPLSLFMESFISTSSTNKLAQIDTITATVNPKTLDTQTLLTSSQTALLLKTKMQSHCFQI